jgi:hypothetical protein
MKERAMPYYTSREQDAVQKIKEAQIEYERAEALYRRGGGVYAINKAKSKLAAAHNDRYLVASGICPDYDAPA